MSSLPLMQVFSLAQSTLLLGLNMNISYITIPSIVLSPSPILAIRQWSYMFERGKITAFPLSAASFITSVVLVYATMPGHGDSEYSAACRLYITAAIVSFLIFPFTGYFLEALNNFLTEKAKAQSELHYADLPEKHAGMQTARDHDRIAKWAYYNWFRVIMYTVVAGSNALAVAQSMPSTF